MPRKSVNFYGYDKETYDSCQALICNTNRRHMEILHVWFLLLNVLYVFLAQFELFGVSKRFQQTYLIYLLIAGSAILLLGGIAVFIGASKKRKMNAIDIEE